jgi:hypothetical protein
MEDLLSLMTLDIFPLNLFAMIFVRTFFLVSIFSLLAAVPIEAAEEDREATPIASPMAMEDDSSEPLEADSYLEGTRETVSTRVLRLADSIDSLFGDKRADDIRNTSTLRVSQVYFLKDGTGGLNDISITLNLFLPNLKKIEKAFNDKINSFGKQESSEGLSPVVAAERSAWTFNQEAGIVVANPFNYFGRARLRRDFLASFFVNSFYEQVGWSRRDEWEEKTSLYSDYAIHRDLLFRFVNEKDWAMTNKVVRSTHGPALIQKLSDISAVSYDMRLNTVLESNGFIQDRLSLSALYRTQLPVAWIYLDLSPEIAWERQTNLRPMYNFYLRFEAVFGDKPKLGEL